MAIEVALFVIAAVIAVIWIFIEFKRFRHKIYALLLIALIIVSYLNFSHIFQDKNLDLKSASGIFEATKIYFSWLFTWTIGAFKNMISLTSRAVDMDWGGENKTQSK